MKINALNLSTNKCIIAYNTKFKLVCFKKDKLKISIILNYIKTLLVVLKHMILIHMVEKTLKKYMTLIQMNLKQIILKHNISIYMNFKK